MPASLEHLKPTQITLVTNDICNLRCRTCYAWTSRKDKPYISLDEIKFVLSDLREWLGPFSLEMVGGEIFLRPDIAEILRFAKSIGVRVCVCTNGSLIDRENAELLVDTCGVVNLSLNSLDPQYHDYMRGYPGSHALLMQAVDHLLRAKAERNSSVYLNTMCILSDVNKTDVLPLFHWIIGKGFNGFSAQAVSAPYWRKYDPDWKLQGRMWPKTRADVETIQAVIEELIELRRQERGVGNSIYQLEEMKRYFGAALPKAVGTSSPDLEEAFYQARLAETKNDDFSGEIKGGSPATAAHRHAENYALTENYLATPESSGNHCKIGFHNLNIHPDGSVKICHTLRPVGNIRQDHIKNIWFGEAARALREEIRACERGCKVLLCNSKEKDRELLESPA